MDSESLDGCIQSTLSALYPPFEATAATVLCQVFDVVEKTYRGDGLRYLIDFLIPAKHILQCIQQDACVQYCGLLFRHEGWPLCIHEKIVVQLASIDWRILKPGDFYLQVVPYLKKSPRIVLKCLAKDKHNVEEVVIPEVSYTSIFTLEWLSTFNGERMGIALENCLLTTDDKIFRVPWDKVVNPEFINKPKVIENNIISPEIIEEHSVLCLSMDHAECSSSDLGSQYLQEQSPNQDNLVISSTVPQISEAPVNGVCTSPVPQENLKSDLEGEYVELTEVSLCRFGPQTGSLTESLALNYLTQPRTRVNASKGKHRFIVIQDSTYSKNLIQSALMQKEHCQMDTLRTTSTEVLKNVIPLESDKMMVHEELSPEGELIPGGPGNMGNSFPMADSPACSAEDSSAEQETRSEHSTDWRYALCSYSDMGAGDGVNCKAQMPGVPGNMEGESDGPSGNPGVGMLEQSLETVLDAAAAKEEEMLRVHGEPLTEGQNEVTQMDASSVSVLGPLGPCCTLKEGSDVSCQSVSESVMPDQATPLFITPESSEVDVERGSPSGSMAAIGAVSALCGDQEVNLSSPLNPPAQSQGEVDAFELGRRDSPKEVEEIEQILTVNDNQTSHNHCSDKAPTDGLLSDEVQKVSACQHKKAEEAGLSAENDQTAEQLNNSDSLMGPDAQAESSSPFRTQRSGELCEEPQRLAENQDGKSEENTVLNPECITVQDLQGGEENRGRFSYEEKSKTVALKTLESIEEELEVGPLSSGVTEGHIELTGLHSHQEAASRASSPKGTATGCLCVYLF
uniref:Rho guanine nucleotide exchange factor 40 n=1 Tax=Athene cunicularia TaxID=194338 RepID=A0A663MPM7_ATHCN